MAESDNLAEKIEKRLPKELAGFLRNAGRLADSKNEKLYLVGGVVRDLLLDKTNLDIDLVVEGNAITFAGELSKGEAGKITIHKQFNTAKFDWHGWSIDVASAREESYARPGALPAVKPGCLSDDLRRRDFTINAMAVCLSHDDYGRLIDPYGGQKDLESGKIRILHQQSFIDDSTRIWRGLRYEQRLDFQLEPETLHLLKRDIPMLDTVSGDRIRYELECILKEELPEKVFRRADELGVLAKLSPSLKGDGWLADRFRKARETCSPDKPPMSLYLALLTYNMESEAREQLISYLKLPKKIAQTLRDTAAIKEKMPQLADAGLQPSAIYHLLEGYSAQSLTASLIASDSAVAIQNIRLYTDKLRTVKPMLTGEDLIKMRVPQGPRIKEALGKLLDARLDDRVKTREDEERLIKSV